jgi:MTH538 TIR-like domain (DUF1863)
MLDKELHMRNVFISFHHEDEFEVAVFCKRFAQYFNEMRTLGVSEEGDEYAEKINSSDPEYVMRNIREQKISGTCCTIVLLGRCTWARRYIDWEIAATLRNNPLDPRGGIIAVQLPSAHENGWAELPPRLSLNISSENGVQTGYARSYGPAPSDGTIANWVEDAVIRCENMQPSTGSTSNLRVNSSSCP